LKDTVIGVDASRNRSGGAIEHLLGIFSNIEPKEFNIKKVHLWAPYSVLQQLESFDWLVKHHTRELQQSLIKQIWWQFKKLSFELKKNKCDILFATDASSFSRFKPMVVLSQDMLSYEPGRIRAYGISTMALRLISILFLQNSVFRHADGTIFLTKYASEMIQRKTGALPKSICIPHGVDDSFRQIKEIDSFPINPNHPIKCIYVSNTEVYKNQWVVVKAISALRDVGYNIHLKLVGGGKGTAQKLLINSLKKYDPRGEFVEITEFVQHSQIADFLQAADIFIFASSCENMPVTLIEGMTSGLPIACSDRGPMPEVLQDGGVYFDPENSASIAHAIEKLINNKSIREDSAKRAKNLSEQYSWKRCANQTWTYIVDTYKDLSHG